jgi:hypothetical protein
MNLGQQPIAGYKWAAGIAYVAIPRDLDRATYITECYKQGLISIRTEDGGFYNRVPVSLWAFNFIEFPEKEDENGSTVAYINEPIHNQPMVIAIVNKNDELVDLVEHQFKLKRKYKDNFVEIVGSAKGGYLGINVDAENDAEVFINVVNKNKTAKLDISIDGEIITHTTGDATHTRYGEYTNETIEENDESQSAYHKQTTSSNEFKNDNFKINEGSDPMTLGNKLKSLLDDFFDELYKSTVPTQMGLQYLTNRELLHKYKDRTDEFLSEISFTD